MQSTSTLKGESHENLVDSFVGRDGSRHVVRDERRQHRSPHRLHAVAEGRREDRSGRVQWRLREHPLSRHPRDLRAPDLGALQGCLWLSSREDDCRAPGQSARTARWRERAGAESRHRQPRGAGIRPRRSRRSGEEPSPELQPRGRCRVSELLAY